MSWFTTNRSQSGKLLRRLTIQDSDTPDLAMLTVAPDLVLVSGRRYSRGVWYVNIIATFDSPLTLRYPHHIGVAVKNTEICGLLPHGTCEVSGRWVWSLKSTYGLPLGYVFDWMKARSMVPNWIDILLAAEADGMNILKAINMISYEVKETWGEYQATNVKSVMVFALVNDRLPPPT